MSKYQVVLYTDDLGTAQRLLNVAAPAVDSAQLYARANPNLPGMFLLADQRTRPMVHFVGFRNHLDGGRQYQNAVRLWGDPDFVHYVWDHRAKADVTDCDVVVFAKFDPDSAPSPYSYDDSNQPDDPAAKERNR